LYSRFPIKRRSLRRRIVLLTALGMFVILGVMGVSSFLSVRQTIERSLQERLLLAQNVASHLDYIIQQNLIRLQDIAFTRGVDFQDEDLEPEKLAVHNAYLNSIFTDGVFLLDERGRLQWREPRKQGSVEHDFSTYPHLKETIATGKPFVSNLFSLPLTGKKVVTVLVPIRGWEGRVLGVVGGDINPTNSCLLDVLRLVKMGDTGYIDLVDGQGVVLASTRLNRVLEDSDHGNYLSDLIRSKKSSVRTCHRCHQQEQVEKRETEVMAFAPLPHIPWGVSIRQSESEVLAPARAMTRRFLLFSIPLIAITMVLAASTAQSVIRPIETLTAATRRISGGDLAEPIPSVGEDEIGRLGESFDLMRVKLKDSLDQIQRWNRVLEDKVHQRTRELRESRDYLQTIVDSLDDQLMVLDADMKVVCANTALMERQGLSLEQVTGRPCFEVSHNASFTCQGPQCECPAKEVWETGNPRRVVHVHNDDGSGPCYIELIASPIKDKKGEVVQVVELLRDITEEEKQGHELLRMNRELSLLNTIAMAVTISLDLEETLHYSFDSMLELAQAEAGGIFLWEGIPPVLRPAIFKGISKKAAARVGSLIQEGKIPDSTETLSHHENILPFDYTQLDGRELVGEGFRSYLHLPLISKGNALGSVWLATRKKEAFSTADAALLNSVGGQIAVAIENASLYREVQRKEEIRGELLKKVISAQEDERKRIARELHDETSQALVALTVAIERTMVESGTENHKQRVEEMKKLVVNTLESVHRLIYDLRPSVLDDLGLQSAIRWYAESHLEPLGISLTFQTSGRERRLAGQMETVLFRVVQEAITNIIRHSEAEDAKITIDFRENRVSIMVEDDGKGFDVESATAGKLQKTSGLGLLGMQERISLVEGRLQISSITGRGTSIVIEVPLSGEDA
jgi:PAS domain S-box-containing protein